MAVALAASPSHSMTLAAAPVYIHVHSRSNWATSTLVESLSPYVTVSTLQQTAGRRGEAVDLLVDSDLARRLGASLTALAEENHAVLGHLHVVRKVAGVASTRRTCYLLWTRDAPSATHVIVSDRSPASAKLLLRAVRGIASRMLVAAGWAPLHAASVVTPFGAVCLIGPRATGKTTALLGLLETGIASFLANDTVFLGPPDSEAARAPWVRGLPFAVSIRWSSTQLFPALSRLLDQAPQLHCDNTNLVRPETDHDAGRRVQIPSNLLADAFGVSVIPQAPLAGVIGVNYQGSGRPSRWQRVDALDSLRLLRSQYLTEWLPDDEYEVNRVLTDPARLRERHQLVLGSVSRRLPAAVFQSGDEAPLALQGAIMDLMS